MTNTNSLKSKFLRTLLFVSALIGASTLGIVVWTSTQAAAEHLAAIRAQIEKGVTSKGVVLTTSIALALRGLTVDNAFVDMQRLVDQGVKADDELVFGVFVNSELKALALSRRGVSTTNEGPTAEDAWKGLGLRADELLVDRLTTKRVTRMGQELLEVVAPVVSDDGERLGAIRYALSTRPMHDALSRAKREANTRLVRSVALISALVVAATLLGLALSRAQAVRITTPVEELTKAAEALARGRHSIRVQLDSGDELELLGSSFNRMAEELVASYKRLQEMNHTLEQKVVERTAELALKNRDMKLVLDNVDQGFITLSREGVICGEPSRVVGRWFGNGHADVPLAAYVGGVAAEFASRFEFGWTQVVDDLLPLELALDQLPARMQSEHRTWTLRYLPFDQDGRFEGVLVVIDDVTELLAREREEAAQSELMRAFGKLIADRSGFMDFLSEASGMVEEIRAKAERPAELIALKRTLHTLKGNAAVMGLSVVASICHTLEDQLAERGAMSEGTLDELSSRWDAITEHVQRFTGDSTQSFVELSESEYTDLVASLASDPHQGELLRQVLTFRLEPAERALGRLGQQAQAIARRLGKGEVQVEVRATGVRLNRQIWAPFFADMIHVVRNAMDHGLESAEQRRRAGKTPAGKLLLRAETSQSELVFEVTDDGRGIDWALIAEKAKRGGLPHLTQADLTAALCADGISTLDEVSDLSGRGIGMAAVKTRIQALHGSLEVRSTKGAGTTWLIRFPLFAPRATGTAA